MNPLRGLFASLSTSLEYAGVGPAEEAERLAGIRHVAAMVMLVFIAALVVSLVDPGLLPGSLAQSPPALPGWDWQADGDTLGWGSEHNLTGLEARGGSLCAQLGGVDPWVIGPAMGVDAGTVQFIRLRARVAHPGGGSIYWQRADDPTFSQAKMAPFRYTTTTGISDILIDLREHPEWRGTITRFRLDPIDLYPTAVDGQFVEIDGLHLIANEERPPSIEAGRLQGPRTLVVNPGAQFELRMVLTNTGGRAATGLSAVLRLPDGIAEVTALHGALASLEPDQSLTLRWSVKPTRAGALPSCVTVRSGNHRPVYGALRTLVLPAQIPGEGPGLADAESCVVAPRFEFGYGPLLVGPTGNDGPACVLPFGGCVFYLDGDGLLNGLEITGDKIGQEANSLRMAGTSSGPDGARFDHRSALRATNKAGTYGLRYELRCSRPVQVLAFHGPTLYAGEPDGNTDKQEALFPGLEWLVGDEQSSSELDVSGPARFRYVPHPNRVTVPTMAVRTSGVLAGLMWNPTQQWGRGQDRPSAVFAVPNTLEERDDNLMGLVAPSVPGFTDENAQLASRPYLLEPGDPVRLSATLVLRREDACARIVEHWMDKFGLVPPAPARRVEPLEGLEFTLRGYLETLWVPDQNAWSNTYGPPGSVAPHYPFMRDMTIASRILPEGELKDRVFRQVTAARGTTRGGFGLPTAAYQGLLIHWVNVRERGAARKLMTTQLPDGGWGFAPDPKSKGAKNDPFTLGVPGQVELGTCASNARSLLRFARVSLDEEARQAGLKALERMARFDVPRAAQVWEVPVHTPDVVAAAQAVRAFLEGYRITGDDEWLGQAVRWARLGLPFIYLWDSGEYPFMRYGSIPVFGGSWFTGAWFGRIVQWNGLEYAAALLELREFDDSLPWEQMARGLVASAGNQQAEDGGPVGLYPDAIDLTNGNKSDFWVTPYQHCECLFRLMDVIVEPLTAGVDVGGRKLAITAPARIEDVAFDAGSRTLRFTCRFSDPGAHHVLLAGCPSVSAVTVDGAQVTSMPDLWEAGSSGWTRDDPARMVEIRIGAGDTAQVSMDLQQD